MNICTIYNFYLIIFLIILFSLSKNNSSNNNELNLRNETLDKRNTIKNNYRDICLKNNIFIKDKCKIF